MKLHLPSVLRKALLSSIAALASALPGTLASGALATGFCSFSWAASPDMDIVDESLLEDEEDTDGVFSQEKYSIAPIANENDGGQLYDVDGRNYSGEIWVWDGTDYTGLTNTLFYRYENQGADPGEKNGRYGIFWTTGTINPANTLLIKGATGRSEIQVSDWGGKVYFGGLIVEESVGANNVLYVIDGPNRDKNEKQKIVFSAPTKVLISLKESLWFDCDQVTVQTDSDWYLAAGKTLTFSYKSENGNHTSTHQNGYAVNEGVTVNLRSFEDSDEGGILATDLALTLNSNSVLSVGKGITFKLGASLNGSGSLELTRGSTLVLGTGTVNLSSGTLSVVGDSSSLVSIQVDMAGGAVLNLGASNLEQLTTENFSLSFINGTMSNGWEYKLLDLTGLDYTAESSAFIELQDQIVGMLSSEHMTRGREFSLKLVQDGDSTYGTLHLDVMQCTLTWKSGSSTWSEGVEGSSDVSWRGEISGTEQDTYFAQGDHAIFDLTSGGTVNLSGSIIAGDVLVDGGGTWTFEGDGNLTASSLTIRDGRLIMSSTGTMNFAVTVEENGVLRLNNYSSWAGTLTGTGTLELELGGFNSLGALALESGDMGAFIDTLSGGGLFENGTVKLVDTLLTIGSSVAAPQNRFKSIKHLYISDGSMYAFRVGANNSDAQYGQGVTLYLEGEGKAVTYQGETVSAALGIGFPGTNPDSNNNYKNLHFRLASDVVLKSDAAIYVSKYQIGHLYGSMNANGHTLTVKGSLGKLAFSGGFTATGDAGNIDVQ